MANIGTKLATFFFGIKVGIDEFGNTYYKSRKTVDYIGKYNTERRWVIYNGKSEASKIPPYWHGWIHYYSDELPEITYIKSNKWQKNYLPNLTGTNFFYSPSGHKEKLGKRDKATGDYESWKPKI